MKKKIYFIISAILQMLSLIGLVASSNEAFEKTISTVNEVYSSFSIEFQNRIANMLNSVGVYYIIVPAILCIIINIIVLIFAFTNNIVKKKGLIIALSIICILLGGSSIVIFLSFVNLVLLLSIKKEEDALKKEKKKLPEVKEKKYSKKELTIAAIFFLIYFSQFIWGDYIPKNNILVSFFISISFYTLLFILVFVLFCNKIINDFKKLIKNFRAYIEFDLPKYGLMILSFFVVNLICILITKNTTSVNQESIESLPKLVMIILSVIWAPIVEETVFRETIRRYVTHKWVFIIFSAFVFGFLHAMSEGSLFEIVMTTLPYATLGGWLSYIYYKTDNLANNIMIHAIWNLFAVIISIFVGMII